MEWLNVLRRECKRQGSSQARVAATLNLSPTVISQVLAEKYPGNLERVRALVEGAYMGKTVDCPVVGDLPRNRCIEYQDQSFAATNPMRVQLYHACRNGCPFSKHRG